MLPWVLLITNGCATTDQYGCTARQNRLATKHYYKAKAKCPGRVDLLYRTDNPIHDSSYTETVYLPGEPIVKVDTVVSSDTVHTDGYFYITKRITKTIRISQVDTSVRVQERVKTITVTLPGASKPEWEWRSAAILFALLFLWRLFSAK